MGARIAYRIACSDWYKSKESLFEWPLQWWHITTPCDLEKQAKRNVERLITTIWVDHMHIKIQNAQLIPGDKKTQNEISWWTARYLQNEILKKQIESALQHEKWAELHALLTGTMGPTVPNEK